MCKQVFEKYVECGRELLFNELNFVFNLSKAYKETLFEYIQMESLNRT